MNDKVAIEVENVSKKYCKSLKRSILYGIKDIGRNVLGMSSHSEKLRKDEFWVLDRFIEGAGLLATTVGGSRVIGQLYTMLFLSDKPLCLDDMVEKLKTSKGDASLNIRELERLRVVKKVWVKGDTKDFYEAELDFEKIIKSGLIRR